MAKKRRSQKKYFKNNRFESQRRKIDIHRDVLRGLKERDFKGDYRTLSPEIKRNRSALIRLDNAFNKSINEINNKYKVTIPLHSVELDAIKERKETVCKKRKEKRRSLFRIGAAGKGVAGPLRKVINAESKVRCK